MSARWQPRRSPLPSHIGRQKTNQLIGVNHVGKLAVVFGSYLFLFSYSPSLKSDGKVAVPAAQTRLPSDMIIREFVDKIIKCVSIVVEFVCVSVCFAYEII